MASEDDLLARELSKIAAGQQKLAENLLGTRVAGGAQAASVGATLAAGFLPTERFEMTLELRADPQIVLTKVFAFLTSAGHITQSDEVRDLPHPTISGVLQSGFLNMNPALVYAEILRVGGDMCSVRLTGAAKEGLIKQQTAAKAVERLAEALKSVG